MELRPLVLVEGGTQRCVVLASNSTDGFEGLPSLRRQVKSVAPAIVGAVAALHEAKSFKLVHKEDETAREDAEHRAERLLAQPFVGAEHAEDARVRRREPKRS
jgi:hypothetical protein